MSTRELKPAATAHNTPNDAAHVIWKGKMKFEFGTTKRVRSTPPLGALWFDQAVLELVI